MRVVRGLLEGGACRYIVTASIIYIRIKVAIVCICGVTVERGQVVECGVGGTGEMAICNITTTQRLSQERITEITPSHLPSTFKPPHSLTLSSPIYLELRE